MVSFQLLKFRWALNLLCRTCALGHLWLSCARLKRLFFLQISLCLHHISSHPLRWSHTTQTCINSRLLVSIWLWRASSRHIRNSSLRWSHSWWIYGILLHDTTSISNKFVIIWAISWTFIWLFDVFGKCGSLQCTRTPSTCHCHWHVSWIWLSIIYLIFVLFELFSYFILLFSIRSNWVFIVKCQQSWSDRGHYRSFGNIGHSGFPRISTWWLHSWHLFWWQCLSHATTRAKFTHRRCHTLPTVGFSFGCITSITLEIMHLTSPMWLLSTLLIVNWILNWLSVWSHKDHRLTKNASADWIVGILHSTMQIITEYICQFLLQTVCFKVLKYYFLVGGAYISLKQFSCLIWV